ncbi:MAG: hypothetical protein V2I76_08305, partial [Roseobacter sp.]|nr:hypothetical protein [Roseobacter sp.]
MTPLSIGDLASTFSTRLEMSRLKSETESLSTELSTGRKADIAAEERGDFSRLSALERSIAIVDRYKTANADTAFRLDTAQLALGNVQSTVSEGVSHLLSASAGQDPASFATAANAATLGLQSVLSSLNTSVAGASIF